MKLTIDQAVNKFLCWKLPKDFSPDCGISFDGRQDDDWNKNKTWPTGTNILTAEQARAMFEHCFAGVESREAQQVAVPQEPVGVVDESDDGLFVDLETPDGVMVKRVDKLYAAPQPAYVPLSDAEIKVLIPCGDAWKYEVGFDEATKFARAIEQAVRGKT